MARPIEPDIRLLAALADPVRLDILHELAGSAEVCACDFTECCDVSQPTISHHLKVLREAGAVVSERRGNSIFYRISPNLLTHFAAIAQSLVPGGFVPAASLERRAARSAATISPAATDSAATAPIAS